ncbi:MAG: hypothetical protein PF508_06755 [Spirochaeta sp.]|nr:hypothetical protein [Spirochaeta sp.]
MGNLDSGDSYHEDSQQELYAAVEKGIRDDETGRTVAADDAIQGARKQLIG